MKALQKNDVNLYFGFMVLSLMGNVCADYALMWHGLSLLASNSSSGNSLTYFYVGQAIGVIFISPILSVYFDRFKNLFSSIILDLLYSLVLVTMAILYNYGTLTPPTIFFFSMFTAALAILHKSSVGFSVVQKMSKITGVTDITARFISALNIPFLIGAALSGFIFLQFGFIGCIIIGVLTFLPMPFIYYRVFGKEDEPKRTKEVKLKLISDLKEGFLALQSDKLLSATASSIAIINISSAVLPAIVSFVFLKYYPGRTDYASLAISIAILAGILITKKVGEISRKWPMQFVVPLSVLPAGIILVLCLFFPNPFLVGLMFLLSCIGSAARNVSSGSLRVTRVPKSLTGRVNTAYSSLLFIGQSIGGLLLIKAVQHDVRMAIFSILVFFILGSIVSYIFLPSKHVSAILEDSI